MFWVTYSQERPHSTLVGKTKVSLPKRANVVAHDLAVAGDAGAIGKHVFDAAAEAFGVVERELLNHVKDDEALEVQCAHRVAHDDRGDGTAEDAEQGAHGGVGCEVLQTKRADDIEEDRVERHQRKLKRHKGDKLRPAQAQEDGNLVVAPEAFEVVDACTREQRGRVAHHGTEGANASLFACGIFLIDTSFVQEAVRLLGLPESRDVMAKEEQDNVYEGEHKHGRASEHRSEGFLSDSLEDNREDGEDESHDQREVVIVAVQQYEVLPDLRVAPRVTEEIVERRTRAREGVGILLHSFRGAAELARPLVSEDGRETLQHVGHRDPAHQSLVSNIGGQHHQYGSPQEEYRPTLAAPMCVHPCAVASIVDTSLGACTHLPPR
eukprot:5304895-Prymnesium_polylepis.1